MEPLFDTTQGRMMMGFGLAMIAIGSLVLKKIVSFRG
jgi:Flp pilus assembly protein TadB